MARKTYRASELIAGKTFFLANINWASPECTPVVTEHLIGSECDRRPELGEVRPYRVRPCGALAAFAVWDLFKTRRGAQRAAEALSRAMNPYRKEA